MKSVRSVSCWLVALAMPKSMIFGVGSIDLFVQEDVDSAQRRIEAGVETELVVVPGAYHGFDAIAPETSPAKRFTAARNASLRPFHPWSRARAARL